MANHLLTIASRESRLAMWQATHVQHLLNTMGCTARIHGMTTQGDQILDKTLSKVGGKGLFVKELEVALLQARADLAVHSLKDVPMELASEFKLACVLPREDPSDAWVSPHYAHWLDLPLGAKVGTSSLRRTFLLRDLRPDLVIEPLRGNLDTRLAKLDKGDYDGVVLATAGLKRLGLSKRIRTVFELEQMVPAAGQGALGIEILSSRDDLLALLNRLNHMPTFLATTAERAVSRYMGGSCSMPLGAHARLIENVLRLQAIWVCQETPGHPIYRASLERVVSTPQQAHDLGCEVAQMLRQAAGKD